MKPVLAALLLSSCLAAQGRTFVIDASNGPGTSFTDLPAALSQAQHGDVYFVRPGGYHDAATDKAISLLATAPGVSFNAGQIFVGGPGLVVRNVPAGLRVVVSGVNFVSTTGQPGLRLENVAGTVHLENVTTQATTQFGMQYVPTTSFVANQCAALTVLRSTLRIVSLASTNASFSGCTIQGANACWIPFSVYCNSAARVALTVNGGSAQLSGSSVFGGNAASSQYDATPAVEITPGTLQIAGGPSDLVLAGTTSTGTNPNVPAINASSSSVTIDPRVTIVPRGTAPRVAGASEVNRDISWVSATGMPPGGTLALTFRSLANAPFVLALAVPAFTTGLPSGDLWVDLNSLAIVASGVQSPTGVLAATLPIPNLPALAGAPIAIQGAAPDAVSGYPWFSHPAVVVLH